MRSKERNIIILLLSVLLFTMPVCAADSDRLDDLEYAELTEEEVRSLWESYDLQPIEVATVPDKSIVSFDVAEDGRVAVALEDCYLLLYNSDHTPEKAYRFHVNGYYYILWVEDHLALVTVRGDKIVEFTTDGSLISVRKTESGSDVNVAFRESLMQKTSMSRNGCEFNLIKKNGLAGLVNGHYRALTVSDPSGATKDIYSLEDAVVTEAEVLPIFVISVFAFILLAVLVCGVIVPIAIRRKRQGGPGDRHH